MSMEHKAFAFDWSRFEQDSLYSILYTALSTRGSNELNRYIEANRQQLKDPYEGLPLSPTWRAELENADLQEFADIALTRFYDPRSDEGLGDAWVALDSKIGDLKDSLLGTPFGPAENYFDPGRLGAYFQSPDAVLMSLQRLRTMAVDGFDCRNRIESYLRLLDRCVTERKGLYVTF